MKMTWMWFMTLFLLLILLMLIQLVKKMDKVKKLNWTQFECGFNLMNPSHLSFSFQFFLISLLFLIFDIEIALVLSYPMEPNSMKKMLLMTMFIVILAIGLIYEWQKSKIKWSK